MAQSAAITPSLYTLQWGQTADKNYEIGIGYVALYPKATTATADTSYQAGSAWQGVSAINESTEGGEYTSVYADNIEYLKLLSNEEFGFTIEAYTSPSAFYPCDGKTVADIGDVTNSVPVPGMYLYGQERQKFGIAYITDMGQDGSLNASKLHIIYEAKAKPSSRDNQTINEDPEAVTFSWECETEGIDVTALIAGATNKTAHIIIEGPGTGKISQAKWDALLTYMFGDGNSDGYLPNPTKIATLLGVSQVSGVDKVSTSTSSKSSK